MAGPVALFDDDADESAPSARGHVKALLAAHPGPALLLGADGQPRALNGIAAAIGRALAAGGLDPLRDTARRVAVGGVGGRLDVEAGARTYVFLVLPWDDGALALGHDVGTERGLRRALVESRQRYKDFATCASDFLWETGVDGRFSFVSPMGALGYDASHLVGRDPGSLADPAARRPLVDPFRADLPVDDQELQLIAADGSPACVLVSAVPVFAEGGRPAGARGVWRDVTLERARAAELMALRRREHAVAQIVGAMRDESDVCAMLAQAAGALDEATDAAFVAVFTVEEGGLETAAAAGRVPSWLAPLAASHLDASVARAVRDLVGEGVAIMMVATRSAGRLNGAICVGRDRNTGWSNDERSIVLGVADAVGLTIEQVRGHEAVKRLSRLDSLTGLLNRRAFAEELERRAALAARRGSPCSVFYLDLDHFKQVNDGAGHAMGDAALVALARTLIERSRRADVIARLGGDEFAIWCDDMDAAGARIKAAHLAAAAAALSRYSPPGAPTLGLSIGVATSPGGPVDAQALLARADAALYAAKRAGRGRFVHAADIDHDDDPTEGEPRC